MYIGTFLVFMVLSILIYTMYSLYRGKVVPEVEIADKKLNNMYRSSDFDTAVVFQNLDS